MAELRPEFALIQWLRARTPLSPAVPLGIGDDAALLKLAADGKCLVTVDMLMEGVDFRLSDADPYDVGRKALGVSLSDVAAMAGRPLAAFVAVALPSTLGRSLVERLYEGIESIAGQFGVTVAGGDTNSWDGPLVVSTTLIAEPAGNGPVRRSGARAGDWLFVTGELGGSLAGKHLSFVPRVSEALSLHQAVSLHAMIDISDGLAADLHHLLEESGVGAVVRADSIPISDAARKMPGEKTPLEHSLGDGEDFELLFTVSPEDGKRLLARPPCEGKLSHIGEITVERTCELVDKDGTRSTLPPLGWVHNFGP